ncbi:hypothetical protein SAMN04489864_10223 [Pedobacter insulae]|uniref:Uncharacterized protein n=1 Tax=Pedobacter insulae TaxID=414048 RepID=A0A1I2U859_9SPHI|nr:hypothetical protein SAMN04489864_10223 [Pedobacter insulae]
MRRFLAILFTVVTLFAIKECVYIFTSTDPDIVVKKTQLSIVAISIIIPLMLFTLWLWSGKRKQTL